MILCMYRPVMPVPVIWRPSLSSGGLAKVLFPAVHFPVYKEVGKENEAAHLHSYLNASNWYCLHVTTPMILGCCPKHSCKRAKKLRRIKVCSNSSPFCHLWCFTGFQACFVCSIILQHRLIFTEDNVKILNPFILLKVLSKIYCINRIGATEKN